MCLLSSMDVLTQAPERVPEVGSGEGELARTSTSNATGNGALQLRATSGDTLVQQEVKTKQKAISASL